ncbi:MAG TPA: 50S ribosomal protein L4 [Rhabdochlamydiaceae bacterium]|nr:50S ribosomal protein L4 [Rhabdochlamydiaceae bacterium]
MLLKKYSLAGKQVGEITVEDQQADVSANLQMIKDYIVALRANARQWSASTKGRSEVNHSNKKPHPQKGTGRARQGSLASPQYKGGGRVFTPRPKFDQHVRINKKEKRLAIRHLIAEKVKESCVHVLQYKALKTPKTKDVAKFLTSLKLDGKRVLFLYQGDASHDYENFFKSLRNIPKVNFQHLPNINGYELLLSQDLVVLEPAVDNFLNALTGKS